MAELSGNFLYAAFLVYLIAVPIFGGAIRGNKDKKGRPNRWANIGITLSIVGFFCHLGYFITRWAATAMRLSAICLNSPPLLA